MKQFFKKYNHAWVLLYTFIYLIWFFYLSQTSIDSYHLVKSSLDDKIPFIEWFIIPYYIWFPYVPVVIAYFFFTCKEEFYRCTGFLFIGMTICLIAYTIYPTGINFQHDLDSLGRSNFMINMTRFIYSVDPGTNVCPSIHCYNSIGLSIAIIKSKRLGKSKVIVIGSVILSTLICMSTVFVKQHSIIDVYFAIGLAVIMYLIIYVPNYERLFKKCRLEALKNRQ
ncbi:phosphoesterase [Lachnoclostridium phytofermentans]|uniref:phosphoesterase n=1 Tax=Lachnoclostridium phytofermentans TaxID=66219 RepID=UPI0004980B75|nr:phosphoesterase [Lachnoclostridium phytofermentans]